MGVGGGGVFFFFNATATTEIYTLSLHDALPISRWGAVQPERVLEILESMVQTEQVPETDLVRITVRHTSAEEVAATICP